MLKILKHICEDGRCITAIPNLSALHGRSWPHASSFPSLHPTLTVLSSQSRPAALRLVGKHPEWIQTAN